MTEHSKENGLELSVKQAMAKNLNKRIDQLGLKRKDLAKKIGVNPVDLSAWCSHSENYIHKIPNSKRVLALAKELECSTDYILGLTEEPTTDANIQAICKYTGLSEKALKMLHEFTTTPDNMEKLANRHTGNRSRFFSMMLEQNIFQDLVEDTITLAFSSRYIVEHPEDVVDPPELFFDLNASCDMSRVAIYDILSAISALYDYRTIKKECYDAIKNNFSNNLNRSVQPVLDKLNSQHDDD